MAKIMDKRSATQRFAADLGELRMQRLERLGEIATLSNRTLPAADVAAKIDGLLTQHEAAARSWLSFDSVSAADASYASIGLETSFKREPFGALLVFGDREAVRARFIAEAEAARVADPMSDTEFDAAVTALRAQIADIEHAEESLIREAELSGATLARREDANPALFLAPDEVFE